MPNFHLLSLEEQGIDIAGLPAVTPADLGDMPAFVSQFLPQVYKSLDARSLVLCLDELEELVSKVERGRLDAAVFEFLRSLMLDEARIVCVLTGGRRLAELGRISRPAAAIVEMTTFRSVGVFSRDLARRLIEEPVAYSGMCYQTDAIEVLLSVTGGYPYLIQLLCGQLVNRRNEQRRNEMTADDVQVIIETQVETLHPGFSWQSLTPYKKAILITACWLLQDHQVIAADDVKAQLQALSVPYRNWETPVHHLLHELALEGFLRESPGDGQYLEYTLAFHLLSAWVRRHKTLDQVREEISHDN